MSDKLPKISIVAEFKAWLFEFCFGYCCRYWYPNTNIDDIGFVDTNEFRLVPVEEFERFEKYDAEMYLSNSK